jgi:hypothetical protein
MGERKQMTGDVSRRKAMSDDDIKKSKKDLTHNEKRKAETDKKLKHKAKC